ncbi:MAG: LPS export ABC transporter permease LptG, partial [Gammaproteobacteria bacterium]
MRLTTMDRYLGLAVLKGTAMALLVLVALSSFLAFTGEVGDIGRGQYGLFEAMQYIFYSMPRRGYELFPPAALLGSLLGLGALASQSELTAARASGMSVAGIARSVLLAAGLLSVVVVIMGEGLAPVGERTAQSLRAHAISERVGFKGRQGLWVRDGRNTINVAHVLTGNRVSGLTVYRFDEHHALDSVMSASTGAYLGDGRWRLQGVSVIQIKQGALSESEAIERVWQSSLQPDMLKIAVVEPETMAVWELDSFIRYMEGNGLDARRYRLAFWNKLVQPMATVAMVLLAIPFVFGSLRSMGSGQRIVLGLLIGIGFWVINTSVTRMSLVYDMPTILS